jgi:hypothetical protein
MSWNAIRNWNWTELNSQRGFLRRGTGLSGLIWGFMPAATAGRAPIRLILTGLNIGAKANKNLLARFVRLVWFKGTDTCYPCLLAANRLFSVEK